MDFTSSQEDLHESRALALAAAEILLTKKGRDLTVYDMDGTSSVTDYYVLVTAGSAVQVRALADELDDRLSERDRPPLRIEGKSGGSWVLVDFGDVIVNVFDKSSRSFYDLDRLLSSGIRVDISDVISAVDEKFSLKNK